MFMTVLCTCVRGNENWLFHSLITLKHLIITGANITATTAKGDGALYLATFGVLNSQSAELAILQILINAGMCSCTEHKH